jgi:hypothetical protein
MKGLRRIENNRHRGGNHMIHPADNHSTKAEKNNCTICGEELKAEEVHNDVLCVGCLDSWEREVEASW